MAVRLTEEQVMARDAAREFLRRNAPVAHLRSLRDSHSESGISQILWSQIIDLGWPAMALSEDFGGLGLGFTGLGLVLSETGRTLTPTPLLSSSWMAAHLISAAGSLAQKQSLLPAIASGSLIVVPAVTEAARLGQGAGPEPVGCRVRSQANDWLLTGSKHCVADGMAATHFLMPALDATAQVRVFLVPADAKGVTRRRVRLLDTHVAADIDFDDVLLSANTMLGSGADAAPYITSTIDAGVIGQAAELLGLAEEAFTRTLSYLRERRQFGVLIGSFQALQHRAAIVYKDLELSQSLVLDALTRLDAGDPSLSLIASRTKAKVAETASRATAEAIQMHGGIGMTDEFEIGFFFKRARILETLLGDRYFHLDRFARQRGY